METKNKAKQDSTEMVKAAVMKLNSHIGEINSKLEDAAGFSNGLEQAVMTLQAQVETFETEEDANDKYQTT